MSIQTPNNTTKLPHLHMIRVPGGTFEMGSGGESAYGTEEPVHRVTVADFELAAFAVTQALWEAIMGEGSNPSSFEGPCRPVEGVSWYDAVAFCNRMNALEKLPFCYFSDKKCTQPYALEGDLPNAGPVFYQPAPGAFRLPTEAEWEYAARGGPFQIKTEYAGSDRMKDVAWYYENSGGETQPSDLLQPNLLGLYDLSGNLAEWCWDLMENYLREVRTYPTPRSGEIFYGNKGGSWGGIDFRYLQVSERFYYFPDDRYNSLGFRLARHLTL